MAGTAYGVHPPMPVALRYQVERAANSAKFGYTRGSISPWLSSSDISGNSSKTTITTGGSALEGSARTGTAVRPSGRAGSISDDDGETVTNSRTNTSGAGDR